MNLELIVKFINPIGEVIPYNPTLVDNILNENC